MFGPNFRDFVSEDTTFSDIKNKRLTQSWNGFETSDSGDSGNCSETEGVENSVEKAVLTDNSLIKSLIGNIGEGNKSFIIEDDEEESFVTVPKNLTIIEMIDILNNSINDNNHEELDKIVNNIDDYGVVHVIDLNSENFKNFCLQELHLNLKERSDHQHIYSNILLPYKINQELKCDYSVKELVLLAIAANDKLTERYKEVLFNQENSILLSLLVGGQRYIEIFTEKFHEIYTNLNLKEQIIETPSGQINFFSVIALRKEQAFLQAVLVEYVLKDLIKTLQTSKPDPLYGVFETASLVKNEPFITMVLDIFEKRANDEIKKDLLARSIVKLLEAAMSQEHVSIVEYLCQRYIRSANSTTYSIYEQAFADDKVISVLKEQILKNINARSRKKIYDLILKITLNSGNIGFIERLCKKCFECSDDVIDYLNRKLKNNEFDNVYESILIALSNTGNKDIVTSVIAYMQIYQENGRNSEDVIRQVIRNISKNAIEEADEIVIGLLCDLSCSDQQTPTMQAIYKEEFDSALAIVEEQIEKTSQRLVKKPEAGGVIYNIAQMIPFYGEAAPEEVFADITFVEYCKITAIISTLYRIRGFLQGNTGIKADAQVVKNATEVLVQEPAESNSNLKEGVMGLMENKLSRAIEELNLKQVEYFVGQGVLVTEDIMNKCIGKAEALEAEINKKVFKKGEKRKLSKQRESIKGIEGLLRNNLLAPVSDDNHNEVESNATFDSQKTDEDQSKKAIDTSATRSQELQDNTALDDATKMGQNGSNETANNSIQNNTNNVIVKVSHNQEASMLNENNTTSSQSVPNATPVTNTETSPDLSSSRSEEDSNRSVEEPVVEGSDDNKILQLSDSEFGIKSDLDKDSEQTVLNPSTSQVEAHQPKNATYADVLNDKNDSNVREVPLVQESQEQLATEISSDANDNEVFEDALTGDSPIVRSLSSSPTFDLNDNNQEEDSEREFVADSLETHAGDQTKKSAIVTSPSPSPTVNPSDSASANAGKSKRSAVVTPLALTGVAMGSAALVMYFAFQVSVLTVGILAAMGAFCIAAALIVNYFQPSNSLEDSNVTKLSGNAQGV